MKEVLQRRCVCRRACARPRRAVQRHWLSYDRKADISKGIYCIVENDPIGSYDFVGDKCVRIGAPIVIESQVDRGKWSKETIRHVLISAEEVGRSIPYIVPGEGGALLSWVKCKCVFVKIGERKRTDKIKEHKVQPMKCEFNDGCGSVSITYYDDLGWSERTDTVNDKRNLGKTTIFVPPFGGGTQPTDCMAACFIATPH